MAAFVQETFATETAVSLTATIVPGNTAGDLLALGIAARGSTALQSVSSVTDTGGNTWAKVPNGYTTSGNLDCEVWQTLSTAVAGTVTVTLSGLCSTVLSCVEYSGASSIDIAKAASGTSAAPATGTTGTTATAIEAVFAFVGSLSTTAFSAQTSGYTPETQHTSTITSLNCSAQSAYQILSATGTQSYGLTAGNAAWCAIIVTFKGATVAAATGAIAPPRSPAAFGPNAAFVPTATATQLPWRRVDGSVATANAGGFATSLTITPGAPLAAGQRMILTVVMLGTGAFPAYPTVTDVAGNQWSCDSLSPSAAYGEGSGVAVWSAPVSAGLGRQPVITIAAYGSSQLSAAYAAYTGLAPATSQAVDVQLAGSTASALRSSLGPTSMTTAPDELVIAVATDFNTVDQIWDATAAPVRPTTVAIVPASFVSPPLVMSEADSGIQQTQTRTWSQSPFSLPFVGCIVAYKLATAVVVPGYTRPSPTPSPFGPNPSRVQGVPAGLTPRASSAYTATLTESPVTADVVTRQISFARALAEVLSTADSIARALGAMRTDAETQSTVDTTSRLATLIRAESESQSTVDALARQLAAARTESESALTADALATNQALIRTLTETQSTADTLARQATSARIEAESQATADALAAAQTLTRGEAESLGTVDALTRQMTATRADVETQATVDSVTAMRLLMRSLGESLTTSDSTTRQAALARALAEAMSTADALARALAFQRSMVETISLTDAMTAAQNLHRSMAETMATTDAVTAVKSSGSHAYTAAISEATSTADSVMRLLTAARAEIESLATTDMLARLAATGRAETEAAPTTATVARDLAAQRAETEVTTTADALARAAALARIAAEALSTGDDAERQEAVARAEAESLGTIDALSAQLSVVRFDVETMPTTDTLTAQQALLRALAETVLVADSLAVVHVVGVHVMSVFLVAAPQPGLRAQPVYDANLVAPALGVALQSQPVSPANLTSARIGVKLTAPPW